MSVGLRNYVFGSERAALSEVGVQDPAVLLPLFYINRDCDHIRRRNIEREIARYGFCGVRVSGVDGSLLPKDLHSYFSASTRLTPGEIGCYASHLRVAKLIVKHELSFAVVLEDDALLASDFQATLAELLRRLPKGWDLAHLSGIPSRVVKPVLGLQDHQIVRYSRVPSGTVGYLLSLEGARKLLAPMVRHWPFDTDIRQPWKFNLDVFGIVPPIVGHDDEVPSAILSYGHRSQLRRRLNPSRYAPTGNPFKSPLSLFFNLRKLGSLTWARCMYQNSLMRLATWRMRRAPSNCTPQHQSE